MFQKKSMMLATAFALVVTVAVPGPAQAVTQKVGYYMNGDCSDYYDEMGEYAFFEDQEDWNCYISIKVTPAKPARKVYLQYWNDRKWVSESSATTNNSGNARLDFDPICEDGNYCDGTWQYRVYVAAATGQKYTTSTKFEMTYYPIDSGDGTFDETV